MKLCVDCKWHARLFYKGEDSHRCTNPRLWERSPVTGDPVPKGTSEIVRCDLQRATELPEFCGKGAAWFAPKGGVAVETWVLDV